MAAITANLLAAVAPPVSPPPPPASESVPQSGFTQALSGASSQSQATNSTTRTSTNTNTTSTSATSSANDPRATTDTAPEDQPKEDTDTTTAQSAAAALLAAFGLIPQQTVPTVPTTEAAATATATTAAATTIPQATTPTPTTVPATPDESRSQALKFLTTATQGTTATTNTTPASQTPATQQQPTTTPAAVTPTPTVQNTPTIPTTTAATTTDVRPAATNTPTVVPQAPIVVDPRQQAPVAPPEIGYGLIGPTPTAVPQVNGVPPVGAGVSQAQVELRAAALPTTEAVSTITTEAVPAAASALPFSQVLTDTANTLTDTDATQSATSLQIGQNAAAINTPNAPTTAPQPTATNSPPVVSQLHDAFVTHAQVVPKDGGHEFQLRLDPPELGEVKVRVLAMGDRVEARLVVSDDAVKRMIESQLPELRQRLEAAGVPVQKFDVMTGDGGRSNTGGGGWDRSQAAPAPRNSATTSSQPTARPTPSGGLIDVTA